MPRVEDYEYQHEWINPEPHFVQGYTGYLPGYGPKRNYQMADTYGRMTHNLMHSHEKAGGRLAPILDVSKKRNQTFARSSKLFDREFETYDTKLKEDISLGYGGYVPRKMYRYGQSYVPECSEAIEEFIDYQKETAKAGAPFILPDPSYLMKEPSIPASRPYSLNENIDIPRFATFKEKVNYAERPMDMSSLNPNKRQIPGYTGYIPGKPFHFGKTYAEASHDGIEEASNALQEYKILAERPSVGDWYVGQAMRKPDPIYLDGYHRPLVHKTGPAAGAFQKEFFQGYGGYIPRYGHQIGRVYGKSAETFYNHEDLTNSVDTFYS